MGLRVTHGGGWAALGCPQGPFVQPGGWTLLHVLNLSRPSAGSHGAPLEAAGLGDRAGGCSQGLGWGLQARRAEGCLQGRWVKDAQAVRGRRSKAGRCGRREGGRGLTLLACPDSLVVGLQKPIWVFCRHLFFFF